MQAVAVPARIDAENAVEVLAQLSQAIAAGDSGRLAVDLAPLRHFDSSALSLLLALARSRRGAEDPSRQQQPLFLLNPPAKLQELADLYGVAGLLFGAPARVSTGSST
jgi:ABC-type transporter Mla MlaB component